MDNLEKIMLGDGDVHSPGKWRVCVGSNGNVVVISEYRGRKIQIADCGFLDNPTVDKEAVLADAKIIAAIPKMYKMMLEMYVNIEEIKPSLNKLHDNINILFNELDED